MTDAGFGKSNRPFHLGTSQLGVEPLARQLDVRLSYGRIVRDIRTGLPLPPPPLVPLAPRNFAVTGAGATTVSLVWDANPNSENVLHYNLYELVGTVWQPATPPAVDVPAHTATVTGLPSNATVRLRVAAVNGFGEGTPAELTAQTGATIPAAPTGLVCPDPTPTTAPLTWNQNPEPSVSFYHVYLTGVGGFHSTAAPVHAYTWTGLTPDTTYTFTVTAVNAAGESAHSAPRTIHTDAPGPVINAVVTWDDTGATDVTDAVFAYLRDNVPDGYKVIFPNRQRLAPTRRAQWKVNGGTNAGIVLQTMTDVTIDLGGTGAHNGNDGVLLIQTETAPYTASGHNLLFDGTVIATFASSALAQAQADEHNHNRAFFEMRGCTRTQIVRGQMQGVNTGRVFDHRYEAQDAVRVTNGGTDVAVGFCTIGDMWGNAIEVVTPPPNSAPGGTSRLFLSGLWAHDLTVNSFARQVFTCTYGRNFIFERISGGGSGHSWLDAEPVTGEVPPGNLADATVQDIHILDCTVGHAGGIWLGLHPGVMNVHVHPTPGTTGRGLILTVCTAERVIVEGIVDHPVTGAEITGYPLAFGVSPASAPDNNTGRPFGGNMIVARNNRGVCNVAAVRFGGGCINYRQYGNVYKHTNGSNAASVEDNAHNPGTVPSSFTLPIPAHALRPI